MKLSMDMSYGALGRGVEGLARVLMVAAAGIMMAMSGPAWAQTPDVKNVKPIKLAVLGDSLTAGYGLPASAAFPVRLQKALQDKGVAADILNAGVSGDTTTGGRDRLDWSIPDGTEAVIVELGANDALRGVDPATTRAALEDILKRLKARNIAVMLCGMYAPPNLARTMAHVSTASIPSSPRSTMFRCTPFFLDGVAGDAKLTQPDGLHPTAAGVDVIVQRILPTVEAFLKDRRPG